MSNFASTRLTFGAILGTITTAANAVSATINTASEGVQMLDTAVKKASHAQQVRAAGQRLSSAA